jgi:hypothetical protein
MAALRRSNATTGQLDHLASVHTPKRRCKAVFRIEVPKMWIDRVGIAVLVLILLALVVWMIGGY